MAAARVRRAAPRLIAPTPEFFPSIKPGQHTPAERIFEDVRRAAQMEEWQCELRIGDTNVPIDAGDAMLVHEGSQAPCGTFRIVEGPNGNQVVITYDPDMELDQHALVATFAHELGHYLLATAQGTPPGGWDLLELHTDLTADYLGFGIFMANSARSFHQFHDAHRSGWVSRAQGYLSEGAHVTALVIGERLAGRDPAAADPWLEDHLRKDAREAVKVLAKRCPDMGASVEAVDLSAYGCD